MTLNEYTSELKSNFIDKRVINKTDELLKK